MSRERKKIFIWTKLTCSKNGVSIKNVNLKLCLAQVARCDFYANSAKFWSFFFITKLRFPRKGQKPL